MANSVDPDQTASILTSSVMLGNYLQQTTSAEDKFRCIFLGALRVKVRKAAKVRNRYNQVPHLTQDTVWESDKTQLNMTNKSKEVSPFSVGDYKAAMNRRESMKNPRHK